MKFPVHFAPMISPVNNIDLFLETKAIVGKLISHHICTAKKKSFHVTDDLQKQENSEADQLVRTSFVNTLLV